MPTPITTTNNHMNGDHSRFTKSSDIIVERKYLHNNYNVVHKESMKPDIATVDSFLEQDQHHKENHFSNFHAIDRMNSPLTQDPPFHHPNNSNNNNSNRGTFIRRSDSISTSTSFDRPNSNQSLRTDGSQHEGDLGGKKSRTLTESVILFWRVTVYSLFVNSLPSMMILIPSIIKLVQPNLVQFVFLKKFQAEFDAAGEQLKGSLMEQLARFNEKHLKISNMTLEIFTVCVVCYIIKFVLDWPWDWFLRSSLALTKIRTFKDNMVLYEDDPFIKENMRANFNKVKFQYYTSLGLCIIAPFIAGGMLLVTRIYFKSEGLGAQDVIFTDLNIGLFIVCGLIRIILKLSDSVQETTAQVEEDTLKIFNDFKQQEADSSRAEQEELIDRSLRQEEILSYLNSKVGAHESFLSDMKVDRMRMDKQQRSHEAESQEALRKLSKQEKEIQQLRDLCRSLQRQITDHTQECTQVKVTKFEKNPVIIKNSHSPTKSPTKSNVNLSTTTTTTTVLKPVLKHQNSLHGIPITESPYLHKEKLIKSLLPTSASVEAVSQTAAAVEDDGNGSNIGSSNVVQRAVHKLKTYLPMSLYAASSSSSGMGSGSVQGPLTNRQQQQTQGYVTRIPLFWISLLWSIFSFIPVKCGTVAFWIMYEFADILLLGRLGGSNNNANRNENSRVTIL